MLISSRYLLIEDWIKCLNQFADLVIEHKFKKITYPIWRKLSKPTDNILVVLEKDTIPIVKIADKELIATLEIIDNSLGEFLFNNLFNEEERNMAYNLTNSAALDNKANYSCEGSISIPIEGSISIPIEGTTVNTCNNDLNATTTSSKLAITGDAITKATIVGCEPISNRIDVNFNNRPTFNEVEELIDYKLKEKIDKEKETKKMKGFNFDFGPCTGDQVRMSMYGLAVKNAAGTYVSYNSKSGEIIDVDILNFDGAKFMYKIPVAIKDVTVGDIIVHNRKPMFVIAVPAQGATALTCVDVCAGEQKQIIPTVNMFGFNFVTKIVSFFNTIGDNAPTPDAPFGNMLPFLLMDENTDKIDPLMMYMMSNNKMDMNNPMLMYFMLKDEKNSDMLPLVLMMQNK